MTFENLLPVDRIEEFQLAASAALSRSLRTMLLAHMLEEEELVRRMLGKWVSELTPSIVYTRGHNGTKLVGLTGWEYPVGSTPPIMVRVEDVL